jgi:hypothetical protein
VKSRESGAGNLCGAGEQLGERDEGDIHTVVGIEEMGDGVPSESFNDGGNECQEEPEIEARRSRCFRQKSDRVSYYSRVPRERMTSA